MTFNTYRAYRIAIAITLFAPALTADAFTTTAPHRNLYLSNIPVIFPDQIFRADRNGSNSQQIVQGGKGISDIEVFEDHLYWTENNSYRVRRAGLDGSSPETIFESFDGPPMPAALAIDPVNRRVYWSSQMTNNIRSANLDGSDVKPFTAAPIKNPYAIEIDALRGHIYWTEYFHKQIWRSDLDGSHATLLVQDGGALPTLFGLALDPVAQKMYWTNSDLNVIRCANFDGTVIETIVTGPSLSNFTDIEIDPISRQLVWIDSRKDTEDQSYIRQSELDGTGIKTLAVLFGQTTGIAISVPEPSAAMLAVPMLIGVLRPRRR